MVVIGSDTGEGDGRLPVEENGHRCETSGPFRSIVGIATRLLGSTRIVGWLGAPRRPVLPCPSFSLAWH
jgi:hypothetical protein